MKLVRACCRLNARRSHSTSLIGGLVSETHLRTLQAKEEKLFIDLHPKSKAMSIEAKSHLLGGVPMPWMNRLPGSFPLFFEKAVGGHIQDHDGIKYVDFCLGDTGAMTGHGVPEVAEALYKRAKEGITTMMPSTDAVWVAGELARRFKLPYWQLAMTATDANRFVLRYCRYLTKRPKIAVIDWCYHGTVDETLAILDPVTGAVVPRPGATGPQVPVSATTRVVRFNDIKHLDEVLSHGDVACLLMEPAMTNIGIVLPEPGYLEEVRKITKKHGVLLVIDETHTISVGPGGATTAWNLDPDFFVIGKPIGGGMPAAAYGMSEEMSSQLAKCLKADDVDVSGVGGTLTGNALALAAIRASLSTSLREEHYQKLIPLAKAWTDGVQEVIDEYKLPWCVQQLGCRSEYWFCPPPKNGAEAAATSFHSLEGYMHLYALNRGVLLTPFHNMALFCIGHSIDDVYKHNKVFRDSIESMIK